MTVGAILVVAIMWSNTGLGFANPVHYPGPLGMLPCMAAMQGVQDYGNEKLQAGFPEAVKAEHGTIESYEVTCFPMELPDTSAREPEPAIEGEMAI